MIALIIPQKTCPFLSRQRCDSPQGGFLAAPGAFVMIQTLILFFHSSSASPTKPAALSANLLDRMVDGSFVHAFYEQVMHNQFMKMV